jgi:hypothetical protein
MNIITGEKFQYLCDIYVGKTEFDINCHIYNKTLYQNKCYILDNLYNNINFNFDNIKKIFIYTHLFVDNEDYNKIINILKRIQHKFILILHNSDNCVNEKFIDILNNTNCKIIFAQNTIINHTNIHYLPIGIANSKWKHGNIEILQDIIKKNNAKINNIFFNFTIDTNPIKRNLCYDVLSKKINFINNINNQYNYLNILSSYKFCICPEGNGADTHRLWECLYLKVVPICLDSIFIRIIAKDFPILIIDNWNNLSLDNSYNNYTWECDEKLNFTYWENIITSSI